MSNKGCVEIEDWGFSVHFVLGFQENPIYTSHICFSKDITNRCKVYTKTDSWFQKSYGEFGQLPTSSGKSIKMKFNVLLLSKNYILSTKTLYTDDDLSHITFNYLCENSPNYLCQFWNHKSFFTTPLLCIFMLKHYILSTKVAHQSPHFQTFYCSH